jgi:hypothetical protein
MKNIIGLVWLLWLVMVNASYAATASSITQYGITWTFDRAYEVGQFVNGDWWVIGPVTVNATSHASASGVIDGQETSVKNPRWGLRQAWDPRDNAGNLTYDSTLASVPPFTAQSGDVIVTVTHRITTQEPWLADAAVLTVVSVAPAANSFRPPITRPARVSNTSADPLMFSADSLRWALLPSRSMPAGMPDLATSEDKVKRPWVMNVNGIEGNRFIPANNMANYGRDISRRMSEAAVQLCGNYTQAAKRNLCLYLVQGGIDMYGYCLDGGQWCANGGHMSGRKFPLIFAGLMLGNRDMTDVDRASPGEPDLARFQEDDQTYYYDDPALPAFTNSVTKQETPGPADTANHVFTCQGVRGWIGRLSGGPGAIALWRIDNNHRGSSTQEYEHVHISHWGSDLESGFGKSDAYRRCCTGKYWIGFALLLRLMGTEAVAAWDHNAFFDYCWRWMHEDDTAVKPLWEAKYSGSIYPDEQQLHSSDAFIDGMWALHGVSLPLLRTEMGISHPTAGPSNQTAAAPLPNPLSAQWLMNAANRDALYTLEGKPVCRNQPVPDGIYLVKQGNRVYKAVVLGAGL